MKEHLKRYHFGIDQKGVWMNELFVVTELMTCDDESRSDQDSRQIDMEKKLVAATIIEID